MSKLPPGWARPSLNCITVTKSGNSKLIKGKLFPNAASGTYPAFSATGQDVWHTTFEHEGPAIIVSAVGARCGKCFLTDGRWSAIANTHVVKPLQGTVDPTFLWYLINNEGFWEKGGSAQPFVKVAKTFERTIDLPPFAEQLRIVTKLDSLSARSSRARHELNRIQNLIDRYKQAILAKASSGELTADWRRCNNARPWNPSNVNSVAKLVFDGPFGSHLKSKDYVDHGVRVVRLENIRHLRFADEKETFISVAKYESLRRHTLLKNDILFSSFVDDQVRVCLFPGKTLPAINKADCFCIRVRPDICYPAWLCFRLACSTTLQSLKQYVHGATRPRINLSSLKDIRFGLPELREQAEIVRRVEAAFAWLDKILSEHAMAEHLLPKLDQAILAKAFRGELVPQDPNDEPASKLLERLTSQKFTKPKGPKRKSKAEAS